MVATVRPVTGGIEPLSVAGDLSALAVALRALGHPHRLRAVQVLMQHPEGLSFGELCGHLGLERFEHHLESLIRTGIVARVPGRRLQLVPGVLEMIGDALAS